MSRQDKIKEYDSEPVTYCSRCYSLSIVHEDAIDADCCRECGCSDLQTSDVETWEKLYEHRYGHKYVNDSHNIRKSPIFMLSMDKLKEKVFNDSSWKSLCRTLYPAFPDGLGKADSVILLFAKVIQDNRLDDLRMELINQNYKQ